MDEKNSIKNDEIEIDLSRLIGALINKVWLIGIVSVLCAVITFMGTLFFVTPLYQSSAMFYVNNSSISLGEASLSISSADISASRGLVKSYIVILNTRETLVDVIDYAGASRTYKELREMISSESVNETEIFQVTVTSTDPQQAELLANAIAYILPERIGTIIDGTSAEIVDPAIVPSKHSSPSYTKNTIAGFLLGLVAIVAIVGLREICDTTIRSEEDVQQCCKHPILAAVPDMTAQSKGGSYYGYGEKRTKKSAVSHPAKRAVVGPNISFAASEAYKLLRTKLQFSFADENDCHIIGLSSAISGEGKSLTAVNLAFTLAQLDKKVLLVDCDMRRPTLAEKLQLAKAPGLSSYLTRQCKLDDLVQICDRGEGDMGFHVITAGQNPPNPVELLSSARMRKALEAMRKVYDYVILDLPPVGEVSDALAITKETDGMLLVVRQNYCDRNILTDAVRQFDFLNAKTLGVVFNCAGEHGGNYKRYYKGYAKSYENNDRSVAEPVHAGKK